MRFTLGIILITVAACVAAGEGYLRMQEDKLERTIPSYYYRKHLAALYAGDIVMVWRGRGGAEATIENSEGRAVHYHHNSNGWRDAEGGIRKGDILAVGDSFTYGTGVAAEDRYTDQLAKLLPGVRVRNFGVMGWAPDQYLMLLRALFGGKERPRALVLQLSPTDLADLAAHEWSEGKDGLPSAVRQDFGLAASNVRWLRLIGTISAGLFPGDLAHAENRLERCVREILAMAQIARVPVVLLQAGSWEDVYGKEVGGRVGAMLLEAAGELEAPIVFVKQDGLLAPPDSHWNPKKHAEVAASLARVLRK